MIKLTKILNEIRIIKKQNYPLYRPHYKNEFRGTNDEDYFKYIMYIIMTQGIKDAVDYYISNANVLHNFNGSNVYKMIKNSKYSEEFGEAYQDTQDWDD